ncbi:D-alanine--D-alanine ligase family protein [Amycolatopsis sp.]|uniref:D-alanine--D-alanine ligase family protein n=1 Tax=Amycolatopsis sp. TaxID=37632 RepID=UPI002E0A8000|nr:D-alanine--D-alanine ligase family protein [Amycolatopsis sp.]
MSENKIRVAVLFGGRSGEHDVSCHSAESVLEHLDRERYDVVPIRITLEGRWIVEGAEPAPENPARSIAAAVAHLRDVDVVMPVLHGKYGEDGIVQSLLEMIGVPYVGNGVLTSAVGMDKEFTKKLLAAEGLAVADSVVLRGKQDTLTTEEVARLGLPMFVKPVRAGSSLGVSKVERLGELTAAIEQARAIDTKVLVEEAVLGREIDIAVLEHPDGRLEVGPPLEIQVRGAQAFFDYEAKYADNATIFDIPAHLDDGMLARLRDHALRAFTALDCEGLLRVDFLLRDGVEPVINEVNTFPGFTAASQYPQMWRAAGLEFPRLLDILLTTALSRAGKEAAYV